MTESSITRIQPWSYSIIHNSPCKVIEEQNLWGNLMVLMQRLVVSSTRAIRTTLECRLEVLKDTEFRTSRRLEEITNSSDDIDELYDMDGQELLDELLKSHICALKNEWKKELETAKQTVPEIKPLLLMQIQRGLS